MPNWTREERTVTTIEYKVPAPEPWGACWDDVQQALNAVIQEYRQRYSTPSTNPLSPPYREPSSDSIRVHVTDDTIVFSFVTSDEKMGD